MTSYKTLRSRLSAVWKISFVLIILVIVFGRITTVIQAAPPFTQLAYWKLDEASGAIYADATGSYDATCTNCPTAAVDGQINNAQTFDGSNDALSADIDSALAWSGDDSFSIETWVRGEAGQTCATDNEAFVSHASIQGIGWFLGCEGDTGNAAFSMTDGSTPFTLTSSTAVNDGNWHHIVIVHNGATDSSTLYVNGVSVSAANTLSGTLAPATADISIGHASGGNFLDGTLDEIAIYDGILTETEILSHYYLAFAYDNVCATTINIMPLGNSITRGYGSGPQPETADFNHGYRSYLDASLTAAGYTFDFVGTLTDGAQSGFTFDLNHQGYGGIHADQLLLELPGDLAETNPNVILLHIGTNDIGQKVANNNTNYSEDVNDVEALLEAIDNYDEGITVVLAEIVDLDADTSTEPYGSTAVPTYNSLLATMAQNRIDAGDKIVIVDMYNALNYVDDVYDQYHPNAAGYAKMEDVWLAALNDFLPNCPPTITSTPDETAVVDQAYSYDVNASGNPAPTYTLTANPGGMTINATTGVISWTPTAGQTGPHTVTIEASNTFGTDTQTYTLTVSDGVAAPVITSSEVTTAAVGTAYSYDVDATGTPAPTYTLTTSPSGMTINATTGVISWTPAAGQGGQHTVTVEASNSAGSDTQTYTVTVSEVPDITSTAVTSAEVGSAYSYDVSASGYPAPTYSLDTRPDGMTINATTGVISWTPASNQTGDQAVTVRASNSSGDDTQSFTIAVVQTPDITSTAVTAASVDAAYSYDVDATGYPTPTYTLEVNPAGMTIDPTTGVISWTPTAGQVGDNNVFVRASNSAGSDTQSFAITVSEGPVIVSTAVTAATVGVPYSYDVNANGTPPPTYTLTTAPTGMLINTSTGEITWTPTDSQVGPQNVTVQASNSGGSDSQSFTIDVSPANVCVADPAISYWPLDTLINASTMPDTIGTNDGACSGDCPRTAPGLLASTYNFDGNDRIDVPNDATLAWGPNDSFTIQAWVNTTQVCTGNKVFLGKFRGETSQNRGYWWLGCNGADNVAAFELGEGHSTQDSNSGQSLRLVGTTIINDGAWHHIAAAYDGAQDIVRLYVDGVLEAEQATEFSYTFSNPQPLNVGYFNVLATEFFYFDGLLDETIIHDKALSLLEIEQHYLNVANGVPYCSDTAVAPTFISTPDISTGAGMTYSYEARATGIPAPTYNLLTAPTGMTIDANSGALSWTVPENLAGQNRAITIEADNGLTAEQSYTLDITEVIYIYLPIISRSP